MDAGCAGKDHLFNLTLTVDVSPSVFHVAKRTLYDESTYHLVGVDVPRLMPPNWI